MSAPRYEVRCADGLVWRFPDEATARAIPAITDPRRTNCGPHTVWSIDPDGTETDITDERNEP